MDEYIKSAAYIFLPVYMSLFNYIFRMFPPFVCEIVKYGQKLQ